MGSTTDAIAGAHDVCNLLAKGYSMSALSHVMAPHNSNISQGNADFFAQSAAAAYCPQYIS